jgi:hypothetical protein
MEKYFSSQPAEGKGEKVETVKVSTPEEYERLTGTTLSEGAKKSFGKIKPTEIDFELQ